MRLKHISARNVKGRSFDYDLAPVNIIVGDNASGKTAVLAAVRLALLGFDPKLGKTAQGIFLACGCPGGGATELAVSAGLTDDTSISRTWTMRKGKISYSGDEAEAIPPVMLDPTTYFALTGPARLNYVLGQVDLAALGLGCEPLKAKLTKQALDDGYWNKDAYNEILDAIEAHETNRANESGSIYDWLTAVVDKITELGKAAKATADTHEETVKGLTDGKAQDGDMTAIESVQPQINDLREQHTAAVTAEANAHDMTSENGESWSTGTGQSYSFTPNVTIQDIELTLHGAINLSLYNAVPAIAIANATMGKLNATASTASVAIGYVTASIPATIPPANPSKGLYIYDRAASNYKNGYVMYTVVILNAYFLTPH